MARNERVTLRVGEEDLRFLDIFVEVGEFSNRSEAIRQAIKDLIRNRADIVEERTAARKKLAESHQEHLSLQALQETLERQQAMIEQLMQK